MSFTNWLYNLAPLPKLFVGLAFGLSVYGLLKGFIILANKNAPNSNRKVSLKEKFKMMEKSY